MKPKLWDGPTAMGEAQSRALDESGLDVATSYGVETLSDGKLGVTRSKKCFDSRQVFRYGAPADPTYFLCSWQQRQVMRVGRDPWALSHFVELLRQSPIVGSLPLEQVCPGNCAYIGEDVVAGLRWIPSSERFDLSEISILLMRMPNPGKLITVEEHERIFGEGPIRGGYSVEISLPHHGRFGKHLFWEPYIVPLGWKDDKSRYVFAVVMDAANGTSGGSFNPAPLIYIVSTGTLKAAVLPHSLGIEAVFRAVAQESNVHSTAPGTMEFVASGTWAEEGDGTVTTIRSTDFGESWSRAPTNLPLGIPGYVGGPAVFVGAGKNTMLLMPTFIAEPDEQNGFHPAVLLNMYVAGTGSGEYSRVPWPGDRFAGASFHFGDPGDPFITSAPKMTAMNTTRGSWGHRPPTWVSAGEGCAMFFMIRNDESPYVTQNSNNETITVIATTDAGSTWYERELENTINMSQVCLLGDELHPEGPCFVLFAVINIEKSRTQLYKMTADLKTVEKYGVPYPDPPRRGLTNFKRHVHPGFPGAYDGPNAQLKKPT